MREDTGVAPPGATPSDGTGAIGLLLVGHGSRRTAANELLVAVTAAVAERADAVLPLHAVTHAFLEMARPSIGEGFAELVREGCRHVVVHPYFLYPGAHTTTDIPAALAAAAAAAPGVTWALTDALNLDSRIIDVVLDRVTTALVARPDHAHSEEHP